MNHELKSRVAKGVLQLVARHGVGLLLTAVSVGQVLAYLSAKEYGSVVLAQGVWFFYYTVAAAGLEAYVIRCREEIDGETMRAIFALALSLSALLYVAWFLFAPTFLPRQDPALVRVVRLVGFAYLVRATGIIPSARLESELDYATSGVAEVIGQVLYVVCLTAFFRVSQSIDAVVFAQLISSVFSTSIIHWRSRMIPRMPRSIQAVRPALKFGLASQGSAWVWQAKDIATPILIMWAAGPALLGALGIANQVTQRLLFLRQIIWRVSVSAISRVRKEPAVVTKAVQFGADAHGLVLGVVLLGVWLLLSILEAVLGARWTGVSAVFPALALGIYANGAYSLACSALFSLGRIRQLTQFHAIYVGLFLLAITSMWRVPPLLGYYAAELLACTAYFYLASVVAKEIGPLDLRYTLTLGAIAGAAMLFGPTRSLPAMAVAAGLALVAVFAIRQSRDLIRTTAEAVGSAVRTREA